MSVLVIAFDSSNLPREIYQSDNSSRKEQHNEKEMKQRLCKRKKIKMVGTKWEKCSAENANNSESNGEEEMRDTSKSPLGCYGQRGEIMFCIKGDK